MKPKIRKANCGDRIALEEVRVWVENEDWTDATSADEQRRHGPQGRGVGPQAPRMRQRPSQPQRSGFQGHAGVDDDAPEWA